MIVLNRSNHIRPPKKFTAAVVVVLEVVIELERLPRLHRHDPVDAPPIGQLLPISVPVRKLIDKIPREPVPHVEIRTPAIPIRICAVVRLQRVRHIIFPVARRVDRVRPRVVHRRRHAMPIIHAPARLQRVVIRTRRALLVIYEEVRARRCKYARHAASIRTIVIRIDRSLPRLIDVAEPEQLVSLRPYVPNLQHRPLPQLLLKVQIVIFHVRRPQIRIDAKRIAHRRGRSVNRHSRREHRGRHAVKRYRIRPKSVVRLPRIEAAVERQVPHEQILRERVIKNSESHTHHRRPLARKIPGHADARRKIPVIGIVQTLPVQHLQLPVRRIDIREQVLLLLHHAVIIPAEPQAQRHILPQVNAVLRIQRGRILKRVAIGVAKNLRAVIRNARQEIAEAVKTQRPARRPIENLRHRRPPELVPKHYVVPPFFPRHVVDEVPVRIHALPGIAFVRAQLREGRHVNRRQSKVVRRRSRIQPD